MKRTMEFTPNKMNFSCSKVFFGLVYLWLCVIDVVVGQNINTVGRIIGGGSSTANGISPTLVGLNATSNLWILNNTQSTMHGFIFFADTGGHRIRYLNTNTNLVLTFAGTGFPGLTSNITATSGTLPIPE